MIAGFILFDIVFTSGIAALTTWIITRWMFTRRTDTQLGERDVRTLRSMYEEFLRLQMLDENSLIVLPDKDRYRITQLLEAYTKTKELPST